MEKHYSVQFFTNFIENLQNLCHSYLDFDQSVEVSGYVSVEIDNLKKERYVLSEIIQANGRSISESYCTKVFKSSQGNLPPRNNFQDITSRTIQPHSTYQQAGSISGRHVTSGSQRSRSAHIDSPLSTKSLHQRNKVERNTYVQTPRYPNNDDAMGNHRQNSYSDNRTMGLNEDLKSIPKSSPVQVRCEDNTQLAQEMADMHYDDDNDDGDEIVIVKEELSELNIPKRKGESFRLPAMLMSGSGIEESTGDTNQEFVSGHDLDQGGTSEFDQPLNLLNTGSGIAISTGNTHQEYVSGLDLDQGGTSDFDQPLNSSTSSSGPSVDSSINPATIFNNIRPPPLVVDTPEGRKIKCVLCQNTMWSEMEFVMHMNMHPSCRECGMFLISHMAVRMHMQQEHGRMSMYKCSFCDKVFLSRAGMVEHQRLKHEKTAPQFVCVICRHVFVRKRHLEDHLENIHNKKGKRHH